MEISVGKPNSTAVGCDRQLVSDGNSSVGFTGPLNTYTF